jgi:hypothetical protein
MFDPNIAFAFGNAHSRALGLLSVLVVVFQILDIAFERSDNMMNFSRKAHGAWMVGAAGGRSKAPFGGFEGAYGVPIF